MAPVIRYLHNDINSANQIWSTLSKHDKFHLCGGNVPAVKDKFFYDPDGDFATKYVHSDDFGFIITMTIDNKPVGFVDCMRHWDDKQNDYTDRAEISFAVSPEYRGRGIATKLVKYAMNMIKKDPSYQIIEWYFTTDNKGSEALAKKFGFEPTGISPNPRDKFTKLQRYIYAKNKALMKSVQIWYKQGLFEELGYYDFLLKWLKREIDITLIAYKYKQMKDNAAK